MTRLPQLHHGSLKKIGAMPAVLRLVDHEQCPDVARLRINAGEALNPFRVLRNQENAMVHVPNDLCGRDKRRVGEAVFSRPVTDLIDAWQVGAFCGT